MSMISDLHHINIRTADLAATKAFFMDTLGLTEGWRPQTLSGRPGAWLYAGDKPIVHLSTADEPTAESRGAALDHVAFSIDDYEAVLARVEGCGLPFETFGTEGGPRRQIIVRDPSGAMVELHWRNPAPTTA